MPPQRRRRPGGPARDAQVDAARLGGGRAGRDVAGGTPQAIHDAPPGAIARVLVDGRNVQHALARDRGSSLPTAALAARLRATFPPPIEVELILDGHPGRSPQGRISPGFSVVFTKGATADDVIGHRVSEAFRDLGPVDAWSVLVVTDDRQVRAHARRNGVRAEGTAWLGDRLRGGASSGIGLARAPRPRDAPGAPRSTGAGPEASRGSSG